MVEQAMTAGARTRRVDALKLAEFHRFLNEGFSRLDESKAAIERSQATLARAYERLARDRVWCAEVEPIKGRAGPERRAQQTA